MTTTPQQPQQYDQPSAGWSVPGSPPPSGHPASAPRTRRRWPWILGGVVALLFIIGLFTDDQQPTPAAPEPPAAPAVAAPPPAAPPPPAAAPVAPVPTPVVLPDVAGRNGQLVYEELTALGLTNFTMASQDTEDKFVLFPANWTAVSIEPGPGETVMSDQTVIVTMTKE